MTFSEIPVKPFELYHRHTIQTAFSPYIFNFQTINISTAILVSSAMCSYASVACMCLAYPALHNNVDDEDSLLEAKHADIYYI